MIILLFGLGFLVVAGYLWNIREPFTHWAIFILAGWAVATISKLQSQVK
jgi:hypothetical protein